MTRKCVVQSSVDGGGSSGLGFESALRLAEVGCTTVSAVSACVSCNIPQKKGTQKIKPGDFTYVPHPRTVELYLDRG